MNDVVLSSSYREAAKLPARIPIMAKKRSQPEPAKPPQAIRRVLSVGGSLVWQEWVDGFAVFARKTKGDLVDDALVAHARDLGYKVAPPKR
jgi:hypothetical protein